MTNVVRLPPPHGHGSDVAMALMQQFPAVHGEGVAIGLIEEMLLATASVVAHERGPRRTLELVSAALPERQ